MTLESHLERKGINPEAKLGDLSRAAAKALAVESAYYGAVLSDSTRHGVDHGRKVDMVSNAVKNWPQFDPEDFEELDSAVDELIEERSA